MKILHKVGATDSIYQIAQKYNCNLDELMKINDLQSSNLQNVDTLIIPNSEMDFAVIKNNSKEMLVEVTDDNIDFIKKNKPVFCSSNINDVEPGDKVIMQTDKMHIYIVRPLETLNSISSKLGIEMHKIMEANNLKTSKLFVGQRLYY